MNPALELFIFAAIMAVAQFSPGPDMILLTRTSLQDGGRAGAIMACGIATGLAVHATIALSGGSYLLTHDSPWSSYVKIAASCYLFYLSWQVFRSGGVVTPATAPTTHRHFLRGLLCNLFNPKAALILASMCTPFLHENSDFRRPLALGLIIVGQGVVLWTLWAYLLQAKIVRDRYERGRLWINRGFAALLLLLGMLVWLR